jgi:hypothetical protein
MSFPEPGWPDCGDKPGEFEELESTCPLAWKRTAFLLYHQHVIAWWPWQCNLQFWMSWGEKQWLLAQLCSLPSPCCNPRILCPQWPVQSIRCWSHTCGRGIKPGALPGRIIASALATSRCLHQCSRHGFGWISQVLEEKCVCSSRVERT